MVRKTTQQGGESEGLIFFKDNDYTIKTYSYIVFFSNT